MKRVSALSGLSLSLSLLLVAVGCAQPDGNDRLSEKAKIESRSDQEQIDEKAREMEARLTRQQRFFQGVAGTFKGSWPSDDGMPFNVTFVITPSLPAYDGERVRSMDEIAFDLSNLTLSIEQSTGWRRRKEDYSSGCNYANLKPRTDTGVILATTSECPVSFTLSVAAGSADKSTDIAKVRERASRKLLDGEIDRIDDFKVEMRSIHRPGVEVFTVRRTSL